MPRELHGPRQLRPLMGDQSGKLLPRRKYLPLGPKVTYFGIIARVAAGTFLLDLDQFCTRRMPVHQSKDLPDALNRNSRPKSSARTTASSEYTTVGVPQTNSDDVSVTNSEDESVMNHHHQRETLCHTAFAEQEFNEFSLVDAYRGAPRAGLDGIAGLFSTKVQVYSLKAYRLP